ncbi:hypothetical protein [Salinisphaera aquimarina]|uniref:Lipoprotein n=1 Tax=Salinisphaera aquimarina TaxID=2094031 RepID=A0ABV7ERX2_9GAMM
MGNLIRLSVVAAALVGCLALQGCIAAAAGAGAAGGYEAQKHGYGVQSPVKEDSAGGYKGQSPVTHDESKDESNHETLRDSDDSSM